MAADGRTVKVSGLPLDMAENRLIDKIHIHFLRRKNGGGEISSVRISKSTPGTAFITFEESEVALRLAKQGKQVFKVNDQIYDVMVSLHHKAVDPDEVLLHMSVTVDHSRLPEGKRTLLSLHKTFPDISISFDPQTDIYTLSGCYTKVQSLSNLVIGSLGSQKQNSVDELPSKKKRQEKYCSSLKKTDINPLVANKAADGGKKAPQTEGLDLEIDNTVWKTDSKLYDYSSNVQQASHENLMEDRWDVEPDDGASFEDFSLVVDSDIFRYLHKYCAKEYQSILRRHRVEVLDVTCQDITTLYPKPIKALSEFGKSSVKKAHQGLANLYQEKGSQLRKENISKSGIREKDLEHALDSLKQRLPKLMIDEDEENVFLVGSKSDVSEAKQFIVDMKGIQMDKDTRSDLFSPFQSTFASHQATSLSSEPSERSDLFWTVGDKLQNSDDVLDTRKAYQNANSEEIHNSNEPKFGELKHFDDHIHSGHFIARTQSAMDEDIFSARNKYDPLERPLSSMEYGGLYDKDKYSDTLFHFPRSSSMFSSLDVDKKPKDKPDFISEETSLKCHPDSTSRGLEKKLISGKGHKTKQTEGRELKIAANFSQERPSAIVVSSDTKNAETQKPVPKLDDAVSVNERTFPDSGHPHSLPFIKPSMNSNLKPNTMPGNLGGKGSVLSKMDTQIHKGDLKKPGQFLSNSTEKKPAMMPAYSVESQSFSLGHMDLCGDTGINKSMPLGSPRRRSNSFSGKVRTDKDESTAVDQKERNQGLQTKQVFTMDICVSMRLWLYLKSVYTTKIDHLTSDLQIKETVDKDNVMLYLRGADSKKLNQCHSDLETLIARVETDFDTRTLPLSMLGVPESKDKIFVDFCKVMKQLHKKVKVVVLTNSVMIMGPMSTCQKVEEAMMETFDAGVSGAKAKMDSWMPHKPSSCKVSTTNSDSDRPTPTGESTTKNYLLNMSDQSNDEITKNDPKSIQDTTREAVNKDSQQGDSYDKTEREQGTEERTQSLDKKGHDLKVQRGEDGTVNRGSVKTDNLTNPGTDDEANSKSDRDHRTTTTSQKYTNQEGNSQIKDTFTEQGQLSGSVDVPQPPGVLKVTSTALPSSGSGYQDPPISCACGAQNSTVKKSACGLNLCCQCLKEAHDDCKLCKPETKQDTWGIKGTMSVRELTVTIPGFIRDTTLRIVYDIPDGIQGEGHPCPGAPFKGGSFEAFLPRNGETKKLLPLLEKAFQKGLTFTVKARTSEDHGEEGDGEGQVVWGSIPHKVRIEGGSSRNGYPDFTYIRRLTEALQRARLDECANPAVSQAHQQVT